MISWRADSSEAWGSAIIMLYIYIYIYNMIYIYIYIVHTYIWFEAGWQHFNITISLNLWICSEKKSFQIP